MDLLDLKSVIDQIPPLYQDRTAENLTQVRRAAEQALNSLRPETRSPQPHNVIDMQVEDGTGAEHRQRDGTWTQAAQEPPGSRAQRPSPTR